MPAPPGATDHLTGLGTRRDLLARGEEMLDRARVASDGHVVAVLVLDVDRLKAVNDALGHRAGDRVLAEVSRRLRAVLVPGATTARTGGDEFAGAQPCLDVDEAHRLRGRLVAALARPLVLDGLALPVSAAVGLAVGDGEQGFADLLDAADQAMYAAKHGADDPRLLPLLVPGDPARSEAALAAALLAALDADEHGLAVHHQPQVAADGEVVGVEALLRWDHPVLGTLPAAGVVALAERHGVASRLDALVLERALADHRLLRAATCHGDGLRLAVNVSARSLLRPDLAEVLGPLLSRTGLPGDRLTLEVSESAAALGQPPGRTGAADRAAYDALAALGCGLAVQEFGARASLASLWSDPLVREVKLHPDLTSGVLRDPEAVRAVRAVVQAAHVLGLRVVAEGVESSAVAERVRALGCDALQGFAVAAPMPVAAAARWLAARERAGEVVETALQPGTASADT